MLYESVRCLWKSEVNAMKKISLGIICLMFSLLCLVNCVNAQDNNRWVTVFENFRYIRAVDLNSVEKSKTSRKIRCWIMLTDKGDNSEHKVLSRYEIDYENKNYRITDTVIINNQGEIIKSHYKQNSSWIDIYPDDYVEKIVGVISDKYGIPLLFKTRVHNWQIVYKDKGITYSICKDYYELYDGILKVYYRAREDTGKTLISIMTVNIKERELINAYNGKRRPIIPGTFEEAIYNEMKKSLY